ncbi:MAG: Dishui lake phycodnavirus 1 [Bacteroidota bacterium]|jgi:hypothetical protein
MELNKWIKKEGLNKKSDECPKPSHLLFNGGKVYLPHNKEKQFIKLYAQELNKCKNDILKGLTSNMFYIEVRKDIFRFMIDLDISDTTYWSDENIISLCKFINTIVNEFYENVTVICCKAHAKKKNDLIHTGIHMMYPNVFVDSKRAKLIRDAILMKLNDDKIKLDFPRPTKSWSDIIDNRIYESIGFRMVGSDKVLDDKKTPENRLYWPFVVINHRQELSSEYLNILLNNYERLILETSTRCIPDGIQPMEPKRVSWFSSNVLSSSSSSISTSSASFGTQEHYFINDFIKSKIPGYSTYSDVVSEIALSEHGNILVKSCVKYCMNIGKEHNSCGVYFFIHKTGYLVQKCHCSCDNLTGRKHGLCKDYTSEKFILPTELNFLLFGSSNNIISKQSDLIFRSDELEKSNEQSNEQLNEQSNVISNEKKATKVTKVDLPFTSKSVLLKKQQEVCTDLISKLMALDGVKKMATKSKKPKKKYFK